MRPSPYVLFFLVGAVASLLLFFFTRIATYYLRSNCLIVPSDLRALEDALKDYARDHSGRFPAAWSDLVAPVDGHDSYLSGWTTMPKDPWKRAYGYRAGPDCRSFHLWTYGSDGKPGGLGDALDSERYSR
ncbi:MAG: type II secretion system protein GspG [Planctomycetota bacterium]